MSSVISLRWRWLALLLLSGLLGGGLHALHFPAGVLLACMLTGILMSVQWGQMTLPKPFFMLAQAVLGCLMAQSMRPPALSKVLADWPLFLV